LILIITALVLTGCAPEKQTKTTTPQPDLLQTYEKERRQLIDFVVVQYGLTNADVIQAMKTVPRHRFVPDDLVE